MGMYTTCSDCGANLDRGEKCDCKDNKDNKALIIVTQIPVIETRLKEIQTEIAQKVGEAKALAVTAESKQVAKSIRSELSRDFESLEDLRKQVKSAVLEPYNAFEKLYKEIITTQYKEADEVLKGKIGAIESVEIEGKRAEVLEYFKEYCQSLKIDFVPFEKMGLKINLTESVTKLKRQAKEFLDNVSKDLALIETQEHKEEILIEYRTSLDCSQVITSVHNRHRAIDYVKSMQKETEAIKAVEGKAIAKVEEVILQAPIETTEPILTLKFTVSGTRDKLKALKQFLNDGGYTYE